MVVGSETRRRLTASTSILLLFPSCALFPLEKRGCSVSDEVPAVREHNNSNDKRNNYFGEYCVETRTLAESLSCLRLLGSLVELNT